MATSAFKMAAPLALGAIKSASRFNSAGEFVAKTRTAFNPIAVGCQIFSLGHKLIDYVFGAAIFIAHCDRDGGNEEPLVKP